MAKKERILPLDQPIPLPKGDKVQVVKPLGEAKALAFGVPVGTSIIADKDPLAETKSGMTPAAYAQARAGVIGVPEVIDENDEKLAAQASEIEKLKARIADLEAKQSPPPAPATGGIESLTAADVLAKRKLEAAGHTEKQTEPLPEEKDNDDDDKTVVKRTPPRVVPRQQTQQMSQADVDKLTKDDQRTRSRDGGK